ncbi:hypothetical protein QSV08_07850 [Maribacter sp. BPC-D8]|uniref:DUF6966 domain-containing protein n=1 Tax=Maribacter sp. BPC-D8 TaxID=3053613 RepID=UPI002B47D406|nr:hypothetical protein [Maribacter sp. BPC-D8]WRI31158.1 hypothetical protein QSV08_07850 [Maribacter sp. BPC-D8]
MTDHYKIALEILKQLLEESGNTHWANWIDKDIKLWEATEDVNHHLSAFGGMGSINDLFVGGIDKVGIWNSKVFDTLKNLSWSLAKQKITSAPTTLDFYKYGTGQLTGWRCINCGHARLNEKQIEQYLSYKYLPILIIDLINKDELQNLLPISNWIDKEQIKAERANIKEIINRSKIEILKSQSWLKTCPKCKSEDVCVYRWEFDSNNQTLLESKDNLEIRKT